MATRFSATQFDFHSTYLQYVRCSQTGFCHVYLNARPVFSNSQEAFFESCVERGSRKQELGSADSIQLMVCQSVSAKPYAVLPIANLSRGNHETFCQIFEPRFESRNRVADFFDLDPSQKHPNARRFDAAFPSPVRRQESMSHYEENNVNQRVAIRREPDCDRRE